MKTLSKKSKVEALRAHLFACLIGETVSRGIAGRQLPSVDGAVSNGERHPKTL
jgi:hypothetical protein